MSVFRRSLGQVALTATTSTDVYVVGAGTITVVSTIAVCNRGNTATTFRLSHAVAGAALATKQYFAYDVAIAANQTVAFTLGICMSATDVLRAFAGNGNLTVQAWGEEIV